MDENPFPPIAPAELPALFERPAFKEMGYDQRRNALTHALSAVYDYSVAQPDFTDEQSANFGQLANAAYKKLDSEHTFGEKTGEFVKGAGRMGAGILEDVGTTALAAGSAATQLQLGSDATKGAAQAWGYGFGVGSARLLDSTAEVLDRWTGSKDNTLKSALGDVRKEIDDGKAPITDSAAYALWLREQSGKLVKPQFEWTKERLNDYGITDPAEAFNITDANSLAPRPGEGANLNAGLLQAYVRTRDPKVWDQLEKNIAVSPMNAALGKEAEAVTKGQSGQAIDSVFGKGASDHLLSSADPLMVATYLLPAGRLAKLAGATGKVAAGINLAAGAAEQGAIGAASTLEHDPAATPTEVAQGAGEMALLGTAVHGLGLAWKGYRGAPETAPVDRTQPTTPPLEEIEKASIAAAPDVGTAQQIQNIVAAAKGEEPPVAPPADQGVPPTGEATGSTAPPGLTEQPVNSIPENATPRSTPDEPSAAEPTVGGDALQTPADQPVEGGGAAVQDSSQDVQPTGGGVAPEPVDDPNATSNKESTVNAERQARGLDAVVKEASIGNEDAFAQGQAAVAADPTLPEQIVGRLREADPHERSISLQDATVLLGERVKLRKEARAAEDAGLADRAKEINAKIDTLDQAAQDARSVWGRFGQFWQRLMREDFSFTEVKRKAEIAKEAPLTPVEEQRIREATDHHQKISEMQTATKELLETIEKGRHHAAALEALIAESGKPAKVTTTFTPKKQIGPDVVQRIDARTKVLGEEIRKMLSTRLNAGLPVDVLPKVIEYGGLKLVKGAIKIGQWAKELAAELGIDEKLARSLWSQAKAHAENLFADEPRNIAAERASTLEGLQRNPQDVNRYARTLAKQFIEEGVTELEPLATAVHGELKKVLPAITETQARDAWSGYGQFKPLSTDPAAVILRQRSTEAQKVSTIERYQQKLPGLKTGVERQPPTDRARALDKEARALAKKMGIVVRDAATQLKSSLDAIKTRLRNEIADLDFAMSSGKKTVKDASGVTYDKEAGDLKAQRDAKKAQYDALFPKEPITPEEQLRRATKAAESNLEQWQQRLKDAQAGKFPVKEQGPINARLQYLRDQTHAAAAEVSTLRDLDASTQEARAQAALRSAGAALEVKLRGGEEALAAREGPDSAAVTVLKDRNAALRKQIAERTAVGALERSIAEIDRKLAEGDLAAKRGTPRTDSVQMEQLRSERDAMNRLLAEERNAAKPRRSDVEIALQAAKTRSLNRIAELERRRLAKDFGPRPKKAAPVASTPAELKLKKDLDALAIQKKQVEKGFAQDQENFRLANRTTFQRHVDTVKNVFHTFRAIMTGGEFSGVLRQGKFALVSHPILTAKGAIPAMFKAFRSAANEAAEMQKIESRPNAALYKEAKLAINDPNNFTAAQLEGNYRSRWANAIPFIAGSGRAYTMFLNRLRADLFDTYFATLGRRGEPLTLDQAKLIARFVNEETGSGSLGVKGQKAAELLNYTFFSPKFVASRFQMAVLHGAWTKDAAVRRLVLEEYGRILVGIGATYGLYSLLGTKAIVTDPRSSDFGKIQAGETRLDPMAGVLQATVFLARLASGESMDSKGKVFPIRRSGDTKVPYGRDNASDVIKNFVRSKLSPVPGAFIDLANGEDFRHQPVTIWSQGKELTMPMTWGDMYDAMRAQGMTKGAALSTLAFFGESVNTNNRKEGEPVKAE